MKRLALAFALAATLLAPCVASAIPGLRCDGWRLTQCDAWECCDYHCTSCYRTVDGEIIEAVGDGYCQLTSCRAAV